MQAIFFFALFGLFFAVVQGVVNSTAVGAIGLIQQQEQDTQKFFQDVALYYQDYITQRNIYIPPQNPPLNYLVENEVRQSINWPWSNGDTTQDPWGTPFLVEDAYEDYAIVGGGGRIVQPRATALVLASAGPDKQFSPQTANSIAALTATSTINDVMRIEAPTNSDDIVFTFNTRTALENRWDISKKALEDVINSAVYQYRQQFYNVNYSTELDAYFQYVLQQNLGVDISDSLSSWKTPIAGYPNIATLAAVAPNYTPLANRINQLTANDTDIIRVLESNTQITGGLSNRLLVQATASQSVVGSIVADILRVDLVPDATSAWRNTAGQFSFYLEERDQ